MLAYVAVTRRILSAPLAARGQVTREVLERGRRSRDESEPTAEDEVSRRYLAAVEKMQGRNG